MGETHTSCAHGLTRANFSSQLLRIQKLSDTACSMLGWNGAHACVVSPLLCKEGPGEVELQECKTSIPPGLPFQGTSPFCPRAERGGFL